MSQRFIFLDMDGVLTDFVKSIAAIAPENTDSRHDHNPPMDWGVERHFGWESQNQMWRRVDEEGLQFWSKMEPLPWAKRLSNILGNMTSCELVICSSPSTSPTSPAGKLRWLQQFFGDLFFRNFMITPQKHAGANENTFLIDDSDKHVDKFRAQGGWACLWPMPWNSAGEHHYSPDGSSQITYVMDHLKEWLNDTSVIRRALNKSEQDG